MEAAFTNRSDERSQQDMRLAFAMRAMGKRGLPESITVASKTFRLSRDVKHDFFAATGFYDADDGDRIVAKFGRDNDFLGIPLTWLGRFLRDRETRFYRKLDDLPNVPRVLATVGRTGFVMEFVRGRPLRKDTPVPDGFFDKLRAVVQQVHRHGIAYVDMNKKANIIIGDDGEAHLVDFQISWDLHELGDNAINRKVLEWLQREDQYHLNKHHSRFRPDEVTPQQREAAERRSALINFHRAVSKLYFGIRRRTFKRWRDTGKLLPDGSE